MATEELRRRGGGLLDLFGQVVGTARNVIGLGSYFAVGAELLQLAQEILAVEEPWTEAAGVKRRLSLFVQVGKVFTSRTPSTEDDALLAQVEGAMVNDGVSSLIANVLSRFKATAADPTPEGLLAFVQQPEVAESIREEAAEKAIDFATIMELIQLIVKLIGMFKGSSAGSGETGESAWDF